MKGATGTATLAWLEVIGGPAKGGRFPVQDEMRFGSAEEGEARLGGDRWLSPSHAQIRHGEHGWVIEDLRSIEGTTVNGRPVRGAIVLHEGDVIEMGSSRLALVPPGGSTKPPGADLSDADLRPVWRKRRRAWWIDRLVMLPVAYATQFLGEGRYSVALVYTALTLSYHFLAEALTGQTLGKAIMGIRVVDMRGRPLRPAAAAARAVLLLVDGIVIGLIAVHATGKRQQRLGDLAAGTVVAPAEVPFVPSRRPIDKLTVWAYPLLWLAPCVLLFLFAPWASSPTCKDSSILGEGTCHVGRKVLEIRPAGHTLHLDGFEAGLVRTRVKPLSRGALVASFDVRLKDTGSQPIDVRRQVRVALGIVDDQGFQRVLLPEATSSLDQVRPGHGERVSFHYEIPPNATARLGYVPSHLTVMSTTDPDRVGWISLSRWAGPTGLKALSGLSH
jgi:uncharacterized RDD family membrane protein YckC